jgi:hypothetical protein
MAAVASGSEAHNAAATVKIEHFARVNFAVILTLRDSQKNGLVDGPARRSREA